jgi:hypothetical protein
LDKTFGGLFKNGCKLLERLFSGSLGRTCRTLFAAGFGTLFAAGFGALFAARFGALFAAGFGSFFAARFGALFAARFGALFAAAFSSLFAAGFGTFARIAYTLFTGTSGGGSGGGIFAGFDIFLAETVTRDHECGDGDQGKQFFHFS